MKVSASSQSGTILVQPPAIQDGINLWQRLGPHVQPDIRDREARDRDQKNFQAQGAHARVLGMIWGPR